MHTTNGSFRNELIIINIFMFADLCCSDDVPEVEIISLIEEKIPKYTLRADTATSFAGKLATVNRVAIFV